MDCVEHVGLRCDARILTLNSYENRVFQIGIEDGPPVIGKFYRANRWTDEQIIEEHEYTTELKSLDLSVVAPLAFANGTTLLNYTPPADINGEPANNIRFALYPRESGRSPDLEDLDALHVLGRNIGRIHAAGRPGFKHRPTLTPESYGHDSREVILEGDYLPPDLIDAYDSVSEHLLHDIDAVFASTPYTNIRLHGDCHMGNILWRDFVPHFVDFDDARNGPAVQDLWMMLSGSRADQEIQLREIVEGYQEFCDIDFAELRLIEALRALRMLYHSAWIARRWDDPAFPLAFPWFNTERYWADHILELREQWSLINEPPLTVYI